MRGFLIVVGVLLFGSWAVAQELTPVGTWQAWARDPQAVSARPETLAGKSAMRLEHHGKEDWSFSSNLRVSVKAGEIIEFSADLQTQGDGEAGLCLITYAAGGKVLDWMHGFRALAPGTDWKSVKVRLLVPDEVVEVQPRLVGRESSTTFIANARFVRKGNIQAQRANLPKQLACENAAIALTFDPATLLFSVRNKHSGRTWSQTTAESRLIATAAAATPHGLTATLTDIETEQSIVLSVDLDPDRPEILVSLQSHGAMDRPLSFPQPFASIPGQYLVVPMNEGISYPVEDVDITGWQLVAYGGHGICMPFFGVTDGASGYMAILQTPDDAEIRFGKADKLGWIAPVWDSQKGFFGYTRQIRYVFLDAGGHVAMAKRYRDYARQTGLLKTFTEKRKERPDIDKLIGAANIWCWDQEPVSIVKDLQAAGIDRILWSNALKPEMLKQLNTMGVLTSRYDIYQDLMDPARFPKLRYTHPDWTEAGWPNDIIIGKNGKWIPGWEIELKDGSGMVPCGVLCDLKAPAYAIRRIGEELKTHPYHCRFIDTTTASPWRECYSPAHPMTRTQSREAKMRLLDVVSGRFKLVCGSETGHDAAVPYCDYFEGMLSLGPYRVPDAGRAMQEIVEQVPEKVGKFQVGEKYRLPLWELVYHDACVAQWYWGDYNNKLPAIWKKRDLFNTLYATPPMFMFERPAWKQNRERFIESYKLSAPITRATGYSEMTDHRFLTPDRSVQQTTFANGVKVTVNFGKSDYHAGELTVPADGVVTEGVK